MYIHESSSSGQMLNIFLSQKINLITVLFAEAKAISSGVQDPGVVIGTLFASVEPRQQCQPTRASTNERLGMAHLCVSPGSSLVVRGQGLGREQ